MRRQYCSTGKQLDAFGILQLPPCCHAASTPAAGKQGQRKRARAAAAGLSPASGQKRQRSCGRSWQRSHAASSCARAYRCRKAKHATAIQEAAARAGREPRSAAARWHYDLPKVRRSRPCSHVYMRVYETCLLWVLHAGAVPSQSVVWSPLTFECTCPCRRCGSRHWEQYGRVTPQHAGPVAMRLQILAPSDSDENERLMCRECGASRWQYPWRMDENRKHDPRTYKERCRAGQCVCVLDITALPYRKVAR